ncbi:MAG: TolC family protein [Chitinispirillaceae bacterium]
MSLCEGRSYDLAIIDAQADAGHTEVDIYRAEAYPFLSFSSSAAYASQSLVSQTLQSASAGEASPMKGIDRIDGYTFNWSLNLKQPLITFGKVSSALKMAKLQESTLSDMKRLQKDQFYISVMSQFADAYSAQQYEIITQNAAERSQRLLQKMQVEYDAGQIAQGDYLRVQALALGDKAQIVAAANKRRTALRRLALSVGMDTGSGMELLLDQQGSLSQPPEEKNDGSSLQLALKRSEIEMMSQQQTLINSGRFPSIYLVGSVNNQFMSIDTSGLTEKVLDGMGISPDSVPPGADFFPSNPEPEKFFDPDFFNYSIGLQLSWNIFDGRRTRSQFLQTVHKTEMARLEVQKMEREQRIQLKEARSQLEAADIQLEAVALQVEASQKALSQIERDYSDGLSDIASFLEADEAYRTAAHQYEALKIQKMLIVASLRIAMGLPVYEND